MIDFAQARKAMVDSQLRTNNVTDKRLLAAMETLPRERFVPADRQKLAYIDEAHPLQPGRSARALPAPTPFARLVQLADVQATDKVLDLGCGTGYSAAVLASLGARVVAVEESPELAALARENLEALAVGNVEIVEAPLRPAPSVRGRFDAIVVEGALDAAPEDLFDELAEGGRLVVVIRRGGTAVAHLFVKSGKDVAGRAEFDANLPPLGEPQAAEPFVF